jgi:hypothetical protein
MDKEVIIKTQKTILKSMVDTLQVLVTVDGVEINDLLVTEGLAIYKTYHKTN